MINGFSLAQSLYLLLSAGMAYFAKGITGFGNTLIMASLFSFLIPNRLTTPVDLFLSIPTNAWLFYRNRKSLSMKLAAPLCLTVLIGAIPGSLQSQSLPCFFSG
ncbi:MAG: sulfite exporter TauE/SafE family protein [Clostridia bacterium]|nr:sulfite exporter TauE/SafE family protein [Clostridia bacterium]